MKIVLLLMLLMMTGCGFYRYATTGTFKETKKTYTDCKKVGEDRFECVKVEEQ